VVLQPEARPREADASCSYDAMKEAARRTGDAAKEWMQGTSAAGSEPYKQARYGCWFFFVFFFNWCYDWRMLALFLLFFSTIVSVHAKYLESLNWTVALPRVSESHLAVST
jgi:hypothetical protein